MSPMFEDSVESFTARWHAAAAEAYIFPRVENDPLLELELGGVIIHAMERTGPYLSRSGPARVIVHATADTVQAAEAGEARVEVTGISRARVNGTISRLEAPFLVVDAGFPLVVGVQQPLPAGLAAGDCVSFEALPPLHAFVLVDSVRRVHDFEV